MSANRSKALHTIDKTLQLSVGSRAKFLGKETKMERKICDYLHQKISYNSGFLNIVELKK
ncbi:MAG: hypothetical protein C0632_07605 [Vibrio alginolyticus]|nr:MAG: hypothetical protein C0632_07605 [Vibrio alginolyticus]